MARNKNKYWENIGIAIVIIIIIALFILTIGKIDLFNQKDNSEKESKSIHKEVDFKELEKKKAEKEELKAMLDRKSNRFYRFVKYFLALIYAGLNTLGWFLLWNGEVSETIGDLVSYNEAIFIIYLFFMLVFPKKPLSINTLSTVLKTKIRKYFYRKYSGLEEEIKQIEKELKTLSLPFYSNLHPHG